MAAGWLCSFLLPLSSGIISRPRVYGMQEMLPHGQQNRHDPYTKHHVMNECPEARYRRVRRKMSVLNALLTREGDEDC